MFPWGMPLNTLGPLSGGEAEGAFLRELPRKRKTKSKQIGRHGQERKLAMLSLSQERVQIWTNQAPAIVPTIGSSLAASRDKQAHPHMEGIVGFQGTGARQRMLEAPTEQTMVAPCSAVPYSP